MSSQIDLQEEFNYPLRTNSERRLMKTMVERERRNRMNKSIDQLKDFMVEELNLSEDCAGKLEKADILEMTVQHLRAVLIQQGLIEPTEPKENDDPNSRLSRAELITVTSKTNQHNFTEPSTSAAAKSDCGLFVKPKKPLSAHQRRTKSDDFDPTQPSTSAAALKHSIASISGTSTMHSCPSTSTIIPSTSSHVPITHHVQQEVQPWRPWRWIRHEIQFTDCIIRLIFLIR